MARNRAEDRVLFKESQNLGVESYDYITKSEDTENCIFISHKHEDEVAAKKIADYIMNIAKIDVYLDKNDSGLQHAVEIGNDKGIVSAIEKGITVSSHLLCLVSEHTKNSWWVPYEIGYAKKASKNINSLILKNNKEIPSFLTIENIIYGTKSLNDFLKKIKANSFKESNIIKHSDMEHPLDNYINWEK